MIKLNLTAVAVVLSLALGAPAVADTLKAPIPVKPAQPAAKTPVTTVPAPPAAKTPATPKAAPCVDDGRGAPCSDSTVQTEISGHLRGCGAAPGDISITVNGARSDKARVFQGPGGLQYKITGLSAGTKQIAPRSSTGACSTGTWEPASRTIVLRGRDDAHVNQDFSYRPPLPDLVPGVPDHISGTVSVRNIGNGHAKASKLVLLCGVQLAGRPDEIHGCDAVLPADISAYRDPAFPGQVIVKIPPLPPGGSYRHRLTFWPMQLRNGSYGFQVHADHGREVIESNEENNTARTPRIEVNRPVKPPTNPDLSADIYLVTSAQGAPRVPLDVKVGQPLFIQVAGSGRNGALVNRIAWAGINTGIPEMDSTHFANSGDRPSDAHTWSIGAINKPGDFTFCGYAWSTRDEQATRCMVVSVTKQFVPVAITTPEIKMIHKPEPVPMADLVPVLNNPMDGTLLVRNDGNAAARPSWLILTCRRKVVIRPWPPTSIYCDDVQIPSQYASEYFWRRTEGYTNLVMRVPALAPGAVWRLPRAVWSALRWPSGTYSFQAIANPGNIEEVPEGNRGNNRSPAPPNESTMVVP